MVFLKPRTAYASVLKKCIWVCHFRVQLQVAHAKQNLKDTQHALLLPICSDLNGPDRYKSDWCFVLVCVTWPRIAFRFSASSITVILISPSLLQVEVLVAFPKNQKNRFRWSSLCYDPSRFAGHKTSSIYLHSDGPFLLMLALYSALITLTKQEIHAKVK